MDEVKGIMSDNIEKVLARGEKLDTLVDKTDNLMSEADRWAGAGGQRSIGQRWWPSHALQHLLAARCVFVRMQRMSSFGRRAVGRLLHF